MHLRPRNTHACRAACLPVGFGIALQVVLRDPVYALQQEDQEGGLEVFGSFWTTIFFLFQGQGLRMYICRTYICSTDPWSSYSSQPALIVCHEEVFFKRMPCVPAWAVILVSLMLIACAHRLHRQIRL